MVKTTKFNFGENMNIQNIMMLPLFKGMTEEEIYDCANALSAREKHYKKGQQILRAGNTTDSMGLVISGSVTIESTDIWGNCSILSHVGKGGSFAETYAMIHDEVLLVDVIANEDCHILFLSIGRLDHSFAHTESWRFKLLANLLTISSQKNLALAGRSFHIASKSIRGRVMSYLNSMSLRKHSTEFDIPFDRQQFADYLNVERTALSKEMGKMKAEGIISFRKNHFKIIEHQGYKFEQRP